VVSKVFYSLKWNLTLGKSIDRNSIIRVDIIYITIGQSWNRSGPADLDVIPHHLIEYISKRISTQSIKLGKSN
jgi:hypothetical protein